MAFEAKRKFQQSADISSLSKENGLQVDEDYLRQAEVLSSEEVVRRRLLKTRQLMKLYREQYWALAEELRSKHRKFFIKHGKGGWLEPQTEPQHSQGHTAIRSVRNEPHAPDRPASATLHCAAAGPCYRKPLALTGFCFNHILLAPKQKLYKPCSFVHKPGESPCGRPILCAVKPPFCTDHQMMQRQRKSTKHNTEDKTILIPGRNKANLKLHHVITEYVRQIQYKRRCFAAIEAHGQNQTVAKDKSLKNKVTTRTEATSQVQETKESEVAREDNTRDGEPSKNVNKTNLKGFPSKASLPEERSETPKGKHLEQQLASLDYENNQQSGEIGPQVESNGSKAAVEGLTAVGFPPQQTWPYGHPSYGYHGYGYGAYGTAYYGHWGHAKGSEMPFVSNLPSQYGAPDGNVLQGGEPGFSGNQEIPIIPQSTGAYAWPGYPGPWEPTSSNHGFAEPNGNGNTENEAHEATAKSKSPEKDGILVKTGGKGPNEEEDEGLHVDPNKADIPTQSGSVSQSNKSNA